MSQELDIFAAKTQARLTFLIVGGFLMLVFLLIVLSCLPIKPNEDLLKMLDRVVEADLLVVATATGFWLSRHRQQNGADAGINQDDDDKAGPPAPLPQPKEIVK